MEEYLSRIRKLGADDYVNGETFNTIIDQLQHNIDLLYRSQASSVQNWNISDLVFGNLMDYDQVGQKRYVNGGRLDSLEKILPFSVTAGSVDYEETEILNNENWLRWTLPGMVSQNLKLVRNIVIPEALRHQNILIGFKVMPFVGNSVKTNERFEIYVNGVYSGTGETGLIAVNGNQEPKTIYGVYNLTGTETNLEIALVRSVTNGNTPLNYVVRVSNVFVGLHTLGNSSFSMNFPTSGSLFVGASADINSFYDFENNAVRPIPAFLINSETLDGGSSLTVNITSTSPSIQNQYYIGIAGSGNETGINSENVMAASDFFSTDFFASNVVDVYLQNETDSYDEMVFDNGNFKVYLNSADTEIDISKITVKDNSSVTFIIEPNASSTKLYLDSIEVSDNSRLELKASDSSNKKLKIINESFSVTEGSFVDIKAGTFAMDISGSTNFSITNGGKVHLQLNENTFSNTDGEYGFGLSTRPILLDQHSYLVLSTTNSVMKYHIGIGANDNAIEVNNHSQLNMSGFDLVSTSAIDKTIRGTLNSSIISYSDIQNDGGATAFTDVELRIYSSLGTTLTGGSGTLNTDLLQSFVYNISGL